MKTIDKILAFIIAFYIFIVLRPSFTWTLSAKVLMYLQIIPIGIFATKLDMKKGGNHFFFVAFFAILIFECLLRGYHFTYASVILSLSIIPFVKKEFTVLSMDLFRKLFAIVLGISMIVLLLISVGVQLDWKIIPPLNDFKDYNYLSYPLLVIPTTQTPRFYGPFDEPGVVGTIGLILLVINKYRLRNFWNLIIFIACVMSFSFAFFGGSIVYLIVRMIIDRNKSLLYLLIGAAIFYSVTSRIPVFQDAIYSRMEYDEDTGKFAGDTRTSEKMDDYFASIRFTSIYWWGSNSENVLSVMEGGASYKKAIMQYGVVFIFLYCFWLFSFAIHNKLSRAQLLIFISLVLVNMYHRPSIFSFAYLFLYISYIKLCSCENECVLIEGTNKSEHTNNKIHGWR